MVRLVGMVCLVRMARMVGEDSKANFHPLASAVCLANTTQTNGRQAKIYEKCCGHQDYNFAVHLAQFQ